MGMQDVWVRAQSTAYGSRTVRADTIVQVKWERQSSHGKDPKRAKKRAKQLAEIRTPPAGRAGQGSLATTGPARPAP